MPSVLVKGNEDDKPNKSKESDLLKIKREATQKGLVVKDVWSTNKPINIPIKLTENKND